jgi:hypothetical protein
VSVKLVFGDSLAAIKLFDAANDFRVDAVAIFQKPAILLFLSLELSEATLPQRCENQSIGVAVEAWLPKSNRE